METGIISQILTLVSTGFLRKVVRLSQIPVFQIILSRQPGSLWFTNLHAEYLIFQFMC